MRKCVSGKKNVTRKITVFVYSRQEKDITQRMTEQSASMAPEYRSKIFYSRQEKYKLRYFIRELLKPLPVTERSLLEAKVPSVKRRTSCVYADLKELHLQMEILKAA